MKEAKSTQLVYRLLTGVDDAGFCKRVSAALRDGFHLHGSPVMTFDGEKVIVGQAVTRRMSESEHGD
ncbi:MULTISPECIES: DUF1737 domain-containing protein [Stenotrophomonas]|uniref:DUF1737 domain-containing protein n=1 Tax=Stenotrophomonas lactitubi TaxID=2045214 RepID=A0AAW4GKC5_9GAMM|nr:MULTISPECIES: DUF1737 domain-containing protein [Stenotrophomonas]MBM9914550.1 DUF1737 domain-containing protein [Stenotrophomonas lactitubi]MBM9922829.1 DUF1737 domain-containing protein [Stenotrophomonas lactitubi]MBM9938679.1 DUF1737 domain-containing protein [Stenotrophomonas lactitubi]